MIFELSLIHALSVDYLIIASGNDSQYFVIPYVANFEKIVVINDACDLIVREPYS